MDDAEADDEVEETVEDFAADEDVVEEATTVEFIMVLEDIAEVLDIMELALDVTEAVD